MRFISSRLSLGAGLPLLFSSLACAATPAPDLPESVVVTADRMPTPLFETGESVSVITADMLARLQTVPLTDALALTPGSTIVRNGGLGQNASVALRGTTAGQTLALIDGVRINDPSSTDGEALFGDLLTNDIERVEVLRGPQSALYGSDAIGGVVDIFTRRGGSTPFAMAAQAEGGSYATYKLATTAQGSIDSFDYGAGVQYLKTNGISAADSRNGNTEPDGTANLSATFNSRYNLSEAVSLDLRSYFVRTRTGFDDNYPPPNYIVADSPVFNRDTLFAGYAGVNWALFDGVLKNRFAYTLTQSRRSTFDSPSYLPLFEDYAYRGHAERFEYQGIITLNRADVTFGAETERTTLASETAGFADTAGHRRTSGYYAEAVLHLPYAVTLTGGARLEDNDEFGTHTSYKASVAWSPNEGVTVLHANYGTGFKAPSLYEQFSVYSNPERALSPELAQGWEAGAEQTIWGGRGRVSATWFQRDTTNLIDFASCYGSSSAACTTRPYGYYDNIGRTRAQGLELSATIQLLDQLTASGNYTYLQANDEITHTVLARRPHDTASATLSYTPWQNWSFGADMLFVGMRYDGSGDATPLGSHTTADLFASHKLTDRIEVYARVENLFDARYEPVFGYGSPGRAAYGGIRLRM